ncbi:D-Ala-D-Ala carboxypeptidase family metallohydrolase [Pseudoxanthomonas sp. CF125]|uniref:D-Ala-D-Ala carboxypeptidase family metallohydrolase n=1 Tax=Pseudoxanthomonas sp. CF125 TaxID=1855303 RepID=UPI00088A21DB|nr:D-Ala-D-Ala carboxypeptidase family metallohydrolase [Pseudoxanthomonas sp. CF125]SDQ41974.1 Peptidase M15 [Pseudoxanthomonas sp. CF125]
MAELQFPSILGAFQQGNRFGTEQRLLRQDEQKESSFNKLASLAYGSQGQERQSALGQLAGIDAGKTLDLEKGLQGSDDARTKSLVNAAKLLTTAPEQQRAHLYQQMKPDLARLGLQLPEQYDETVAQTAQAITQAYSNQAGTGVQSTYIDDKGQRIAILRDGSTQVLGNNAPNNQIIDTGNGFFGVNKGNLQAAPVQVGGQQAPASQGDPQASQQNRGPGSLDINADLQQFASLGIPVTSTRRSQAKNDSVDGVRNSFHLTGEAVDMAPQNPQQKQQARQFWEGKGYQVIDEGDHLHAEPPARGMTVSQIGGGQQLRSAPKPQAPTELERRMQLAQGMNASPAELRALVMGNASTKGPSAAEQKDALARKAKQPQVANAARGLTRIENAVKALRGGLVNTGPIDQYATRYTKAGQELEAAVGGIQNSLLSLTRVPGIGSQSDLEARIANMQYPSLDKDPEVNARTVKNLKAFIADLQEAYKLADAPVADDSEAGSDIDSLLDLYK